MENTFAIWILLTVGQTLSRSANLNVFMIVPSGTSRIRNHLEIGKYSSS